MITRKLLSNGKRNYEFETSGSNWKLRFSLLTEKLKTDQKNYADHLASIDAFNALASYISNIMSFFSSPLLHIFDALVCNHVPCEQRFLSCMAFSVYEVVFARLVCRVVRLFTPSRNHSTDTLHYVFIFPLSSKKNTTNKKGLIAGYWHPRALLEGNRQGHPTRI